MNPSSKARGSCTVLLHELTGAAHSSASAAATQRTGSACSSSPDRCRVGVGAAAAWLWLAGILQVPQAIGACQLAGVVATAGVGLSWLGEVAGLPLLHAHLQEQQQQEANTSVNVVMVVLGPTAVLGDVLCVTSTSQAPCF